MSIIYRQIRICVYVYTFFGTTLVIRPWRSIEYMKGSNWFFLTMTIIGNILYFLSIKDHHRIYIVQRICINYIWFLMISCRVSFEFKQIIYLIKNWNTFLIDRLYLYFQNRYYKITWFRTWVTWVTWVTLKVLYIYI